MILESLNPEQCVDTCVQIEQELEQIEQELHQYALTLRCPLEPEQIRTLHSLWLRRSRRATMLRARLDTLRDVRYSEDDGALDARVLEVA